MINFYSLAFLTMFLFSGGILYSPESVQSISKTALVIGNGNYSLGTLANPENDARSMSEVLRTLGFEVFSYENLTQSQMKRAIADFGMRLRGKDVGLFYYAGHGIQAKGFNYLIPVDAELRSEEDVDYYCVRADMILGSMETSGTGVNVIILDACRNNPFERSWTRSANGRGLAFMSAPKGTLIAYATAPGSTASDGSGSNGLYTEAILESIQKPGITIEEMFKNVRKLVSEKSQNQQIPWESTSLTGDFYFNAQTGNNKVPAEVKQETNSTDSKPQASDIYDDSGLPRYVEAENMLYDNINKQKYRTVKIGDQVWFAENLRATQYNDGKDIPYFKDASRKLNQIPAFYYYEDNRNYGEIYGALYNYYAVKTGKLCPVGWKVPDLHDWEVLQKNIGGKKSVGKIMETGEMHWTKFSNTATNETGFTALPAGSFSGISFWWLGEMAWWWADTKQLGESSWTMRLDEKEFKAWGRWNDEYVSVRCIKEK